MSEPDAKDLRGFFEEAADLYDRARPTYPSEVFNDLEILAGLSPGSRVLEIGCGTGQATQHLAKRGYEVVALDLGPHLAAMARRNLASFPSVQVVTSSFEDWSLPSEPFDCVLSATAFHWLDPTVRVAKSADALRLEGTIAIIDTYHFAGGTEEFFVEVQRCYERWDPNTEPGLRLPAAAEVPLNSQEVDRSERFGPVQFRRYGWEQRYSTEAYLEVLQTYSGHRALESSARNGLLDCIAHLIDSRYGGGIVKRYLTELRVAARRV